jgi:hypothetical protein
MQMLGVRAFERGRTVAYVERERTAASAEDLAALAA